MFLFKYLLKFIRKFFSLLKEQKIDWSGVEQDPDAVSSKIIALLESDNPVMIARFGSTELTCLSNYMSIKNNQFNILKYIKGEISPWWWEPKIFKQMQDWSGFFPPNQKNIEKFCELMIKDIEQLDMLGSWQLKENIFQKQLKNIFKVRLTSLEPF